MNMKKSSGVLLIFGTMSWGGITGLKMTPSGPYIPGNVVTISWTVTSDTDEIFTGVYFSPTGSAPWDSLASLSVSATSYSWTIPNSPSTLAKIWIYHAEPASPRPANPATSTHTLVSSAFTIRSPAPILSQNPAGQFSLRQFERMLEFELDGVQFRNVSVEISGLNGTVMKTVKIHSVSNSISISTDALPSGAAVVRLSIDGQLHSSRIVVLRN